MAHPGAEAHRQRDGVAVRERPGEVVLDADILAESIDCETLRSMRQCVLNAIVAIEEAEEGRNE